MCKGEKRREEAEAEAEGQVMKHMSPLQDSPSPSPPLSLSLPHANPDSFKMIHVMRIYCPLASLWRLRLNGKEGEKKERAPLQKNLSHVVISAFIAHEAEKRGGFLSAADASLYSRII